ncbi:MAG: hypothetical protein ABSH46_17450 [Bryobacteraceae bacterium]|jgi:hypothetical protein
METELAKEAAAKVWACAPGEISAQSVSSYAWAAQHSFFIVQDPEFRRMIVAVDRAGKATAFRAADDLEPLNHLLAAEGIQLPEGLSAVNLAMTLRTLLSGPGGFVGSQEFWQKEQSALSMWISPSPKNGSALFQQYCQDPSLERTEEGWRLVFFYFNNRGGVEKWRVTGDAHAIRSATWEPASPDRTFFFPYG